MIVLNIGCGPWEPVGMIARGTVWPQATEIGIDLDPEAKPDVVADMRALPFKDECFYGIVASHILEHVCMEGVKQSLDEMHRVLRSQGTLQIHVPDMMWAAEQILKGGLRRDLIPAIYGCPEGLGAHMMGFDALSLIAHIRLAGFIETSVAGELKGMAWWTTDEDPNEVEPSILSKLREIKLRARKT